MEVGVRTEKGLGVGAESGGTDGAVILVGAVRGFLKRLAMCSCHERPSVLELRFVLERWATCLETLDPLVGCGPRSTGPGMTLGAFAPSGMEWLETPAENWATAPPQPRGPTSQAATRSSKAGSDRDLQQPTAFEKYANQKEERVLTCHHPPTSRASSRFARLHDQFWLPTMRELPRCQKPARL